MVDKKDLRKELILKYPNDSTTELLDKAKNLKISNRRTDFLAEVRNIRKLPELSIAKKERSIPTKYKTPAQKARVSLRKKGLPTKPTPRKIQTVLKPKAKIPFEQTKFGKMVKTAQTVFNVDESNAIIYTRKILKIPKTDYNKLNQIDRDILIQYGY